MTPPTQDDLAAGQNFENEIVAALRAIGPDVWKALRVESMQRGISVARLIEQWQRRDCDQHPYFSGGCPCDCHVPADQTVQK